MTAGAPHFILNPIAGGGQALKKFKEAEGVLRRRNIPYSVDYSQYEGHSFFLASAAVAAGKNFIIAAGGDGTVSEVAAALINRDIKMGVLPFGTGNDFFRLLNIPSKTEKALTIILSAKAELFDAALVNGRVFVNVAGVGCDVDTLKNTRKYKKYFKGHLAYIFGLIETVIKHKSLKITIKGCDEEREMEILIAVVSNGRYFGGGMPITPRASLCDGLLDICIVPQLSPGQIIRLLAKFIRGRHVDDPLTQYFQTEEIALESLSPAWVQSDGEIKENTPAVFKIIPRALWVVCG